MKRLFPLPPIAIPGPVIKNSIEPAHLDQPVTDTESLFVLAHVGVPMVSADAWRLEIGGLVRQPLSLSLDDLLRYPQRDVEAIHKCAGNPFDRTVASRQIANVIWQGVDLRSLLDDAGVDPVAEGDVLIAHRLNGEALSPQHGFPARLVVPGFYGTNSVKWLCRLELADARPEGLFTTELYNDPVDGGDRQPVWDLEPESILVFPARDATLGPGEHRVRGRAWSSVDVVAVDISLDGGENWTAAELTPRKGRAWQTFTLDWQPKAPGTHRLLCRATDAIGRTQPLANRHNAVHSIDVVVEAEE
jgi:sulfane dehydrogenase subunit SoxC